MRGKFFVPGRGGSRRGDRGQRSAETASGPARAGRRWPGRAVRAALTRPLGLARPGRAVRAALAGPRPLGLAGPGRAVRAALARRGPLGLAGPGRAVTAALARRGPLGLAGPGRAVTAALAGLRPLDRVVPGGRPAAAARRLLALRKGGPVRRWGQTRLLLAGMLAGLLVVAACTAAVRSGRRTAPAPPARVTISTGNLTFTSAQHPGAAAGSTDGRREPAGGGTGRRTLTAGAARGPGSPAARPPASGQGGGAAPIDRRPDRGIAVHVSGGRLASVSVTAGSGSPVPGSLAGGPAAWRTLWALAPAQDYHVTVVAVSGQGARTVATGTFRTLTPHRTFTASSTMTAGGTYGVGMPIMLQFSRPIAPGSRAEVERSLQVFTSRPVTGAWYWLSGTQVWFRPRRYWPAHTQVRLAAHLRGVRGAPGVYGAANLRLRFRIGNSLVAVASAASHHMKVWWKGRLRGNWPISTGEPGLDTPDGHYLSFAMGNPVDMDSATFGVLPGDPGYYNVMVYDSVQFTGSGDYIHSAPWSVGEQGYVNVSHGCVNVAPGQAAWYYAHSLIGDPITVAGSPVRGTWGDGWTIWFLPWRRLLAGSATGQAVTAGAAVSRLAAAAVSGGGQSRLRFRVPVP